MSPDQEQAPPLDDRPQELEVRIPNILRRGLLFAVLLMAAGLAITVAVPRAFSGGVFSLGALPHLLAAGDARGIIGVGLLVLLLTPLGRVGASLAHFAGQRDWLYVLFTGLVFVNISIAVAFGLV